MSAQGYARLAATLCDYRASPDRTRLCRLAGDGQRDDDALWPSWVAFVIAGVLA